MSLPRCVGLDGGLRAWQHHGGQAADPAPGRREPGGTEWVPWAKKKEGPLGFNVNQVVYQVVLGASCVGGC